MLRVKGRVKWFNKKKGFGVLEYENQEIFIHHSEIKSKSNNFKELNENELLEFEIGKDKNNKSCAKNITGLDGKLLYFERNNNFNKKKKYKNTENFNPSHKPSDMRVIFGNPNNNKLNKEVQSRDVVLVSGLFGKEEDLTIYNNLLKEIKECGIDNQKLWKMWHGDSHLIVDDKLKWKEKCPTFNMVINKIKDYFDMDIKATRFNLYKNSDHWKPFHHDAAAVKPHIAKKQNFTVGVSFGTERDVAFENAKTKSTISFPLSNGTIYCFSKDVNIMWKHGIPQVPTNKKHNNGRISIIAWGWNKQTDIYFNNSNPINKLKNIISI
jgi:cold shock CspA family protein